MAVFINAASSLLTDLFMSNLLCALIYVFVCLSKITCVRWVFNCLQIRRLAFSLCLYSVQSQNITDNNRYARR